MRAVLPILLACGLARPVAACDTALLLAVDVSGSISSSEYELQMQGLADALEDPAITRALVEGQDALALVQWSGSGYQQLSMPWTPLQSADAVAAVALAIRAIPRPRNYTDTAIGEAIHFSLAKLAGAPECKRHVIDVSGDGQENDGMTLPAARAEAEAIGVTVNGLAIEDGTGTAQLTEYFLGHVITDNGFVMTATSLSDYPRAIAAKLLRELTKPVS